MYRLGTFTLKTRIHVCVYNVEQFDERTLRHVRGICALVTYTDEVVWKEFCLTTLKIVKTLWNTRNVNELIETSIVRSIQILNEHKGESKWRKRVNSLELQERIILIKNCG